MATVTFAEIGNKGLTLLNGDITDAATVINVDSAADLTLDDSTTFAYLMLVQVAEWRKDPITTPEIYEIIKVTGISTNSLTIVRAQDGTSALAFSDGDVVELRMVQAHMVDIHNALTDGTDTLDFAGVTSDFDIGGDLEITGAHLGIGRTPHATTNIDVQADSTSSAFISMLNSAGTAVNILCDSVSGEGRLRLRNSSNADTITFNGTDGSASFDGDITAGDIINIASGKAKFDATLFSTTGQWSTTQKTLHLSIIDAVNTAILHLTPAYLGGGSNQAHVDFYRSTNTSGVVSTRWYKGDNTATAMATLNAKTGEFDTVGSVTSLEQTATGDGTTTIDWGAGNNFNFTFGAQNDTFTFTDPINAARFTLKLLQDSVGSRTATWPANVNWAANTPPTLTTTATTGTDIIEFYFDGSEYHGSVMTADSRNA